MFQKILIIYLLFFNNLAFTQWIPAPDSIKDISTIFTNGNNIYAGTLGNIYFSSDNGKIWETKSNGLLFWSSVVAITEKDSVLIAGSSGDGVYISTNYGNTWLKRDNGLKTKNVKYVAINGNYLFAGEDYNPITFEQGGLYKSIDLGNNWEKVNGLPDGNISALYSNGSVLIVGIGSLYHSIDNGNTWVKIFNNFAQSVAMIGTDIFVASGDSVSLSRDNGVSWEKKNNGFTIGYISELATVDSLIFAIEGSSNNKVFMSKDEGDNWIQIDNGNLSPNKGISTLGVNNTFLFISLFTGGLWKIPLNQIITSIEKSDIVPKSIKLFQNFPNPFNPNTTISYQLSTISKVQLKVYDVLGKEVATLVNKEQPVGSYKLNFDASKLTSGVYLYRIVVGDFVMTNKMVLLK